MMARMAPGRSMPTAGIQTWASTFPTATGMPGRSPVREAASAVSSPAVAPKGRMSRESFSSTT